MSVSVPRGMSFLQTISFQIVCRNIYELDLVTNGAIT